MEFYASPEDEIAAIRRAAARSGCHVRTIHRGPAHVDVVDGVSTIVTTGPAATLGDIACGDGWGAARLLLALSIEDARSPGARALASELRAQVADDASYARLVHAFVLDRVAFVRERGEIFQSGAVTLNRGAGDCDDHFRLAFALGVAGGLRGALGVLHHGDHAPVLKRGPAHALALFYVDGGWAFAETTVDAAWGENPNAATSRLGLTNERSDIAKEVRIMTEEDLPGVPYGFVAHNSAAQVTLDAEALQRLDYLAADAPACRMSDPTYTVLRRAVLAFQQHRGLKPDGLLGVYTRRELARALTDAGVSDLAYPGVTMGDVVAAVPRASAHVSDDFLRLLIAMNDRYRAKGATTAAEDWAKIWTFESGINSHQQTNARDESGKRFGNAGINQMGEAERNACGFHAGLEPWMALDNVEQLPFVDCFYVSAVKSFAGGDFSSLHNAVSGYVATFAPAFLRHSGEPHFVLYDQVRDPKQYKANRGLDHGGKGFIEVDDMRLAIASAESTALYKEVRERLRALGAAPSSTPPSSGGGIGFGAVAGLLVLASSGALALAYDRGWLG